MCLASSCCFLQPKDSWEGGNESWSSSSLPPRAPASAAPPAPPRDLLGARTPSPPKASGGWEEDANLDVDAYVAGLSLSDKASRGSSGTGSPAYSNASSGMGSKPGSQGDLRGTYIRMPSS